MNWPNGCARSAETARRIDPSTVRREERRIGAERSAGIAGARPAQTPGRSSAVSASRNRSGRQTCKPTRPAKCAFSATAPSRFFRASKTSARASGRFSLRSLPKSWARPAQITVASAIPSFRPAGLRTAAERPPRSRRPRALRHIACANASSSSARSSASPLRTLSAHDGASASAATRSTTSAFAKPLRALARTGSAPSARAQDDYRAFGMRLARRRDRARRITRRGPICRSRRRYGDRHRPRRARGRGSGLRTPDESVADRKPSPRRRAHGTLLRPVRGASDGSPHRPDGQSEPRAVQARGLARNAGDRGRRFSRTIKVRAQPMRTGSPNRPTSPRLPAIANAVYNAIGVRMRELPMTPARSLPRSAKFRPWSTRMKPLLSCANR